MNFKIAFYIRVSTEEQAKNLEGSIRNQKERLYQAVKLKNMESSFGEVVGVYIDRAKSGKDTNRLELQKMLIDIREGKINLVMASELSRISRSIKDFSEIWELMKANDCCFLSLRENFDTTTAAGEMVLYTVANIAQFERRQVSERVSANMKSRSERGLYNGGGVILGYKTDPEKTGYLLVDDDTIETVISAFKAFLREGTLSSAARWLNDNGYNIKRHRQGGGNQARLSHFTVDNLHKMLTNKTYIGVKTFKDQGKTKEVKAVWEPIIEREIFDRANKLLKKNKNRKKPHSKNRYPYLLSGITYCMTCGDVMCGKSAHGKTKKIGYYEHSWATKKESCLSKKAFSCEPHRVQAKKLEPLVIEKLTAYLTSESFSKRILEMAQEKFKSRHKNDEARKVRGRISAIEGQLEALAERLATIPKTVSAAPIFKQMEKLQNRKEELESALVDLNEGLHPEDKPIEFQSLKNLTAGLERIFKKDEKSELKTKIIQRLISKVEVGKESVKVHFLVGKSSLEKNFWDFERGQGSKTLTSGARRGT